MINKFTLKAKTVFVIIIAIVMGAFQCAYAQEFPDLPRTHKNYTAVSTLVEQGVIAGYEDGLFKPDREITRTEFCALMSRILGYDKETYVMEEIPFTDVAQGYWGEAYIAFCYNRGIINGMGNNEFWPASMVTLEQATKMAVCAMGLEKEALEITADKWYLGYAAVADDNNLFYKINIKYGTPAIRGDIAQLMYNMVESQAYNDFINPDPEEDEEISEEEPPADDEPADEDSEETIDPEILADFRNKNFLDVKTILIDAGHNYQGRDTGAENTARGIHEEEITWQIADKLRSILTDMGYTVVMTREHATDSIANTSVVESLQARVDLAHESRADLFISIHCNASDVGASGTETYCFNTGSLAGHLAKLVQKNVAKATGQFDRGVKTAEFYVIKNTLMPAILIETGFIDNDRDLEVIATDKGQQKFAQAVADAVAQYDNDAQLTSQVDEKTSDNENEDENIE